MVLTMMILLLFIKIDCQLNRNGGTTEVLKCVIFSNEL